MDTSTADAVKKCLAEILPIEVDDVKPESTLNDLGADSLDVVELVMAIEEDLGISIEDNTDEVTPDSTFDQVLAYVQKKVDAKTNA
jgi:acyl carrier protein